nr:MAG TPA: hypothetical protein [Caudoviricetes sp.]
MSHSIFLIKSPEAYSPGHNHYLLTHAIYSGRYRIRTCMSGVFAVH